MKNGRNWCLWGWIWMLVWTMTGCGGNGPEDLPLDDIEIDFISIRMDLDMLAAAQEYQKQPDTDSTFIYREYFADDRDFLVDWFFYGNDSIGTDSALTVILHEFLSDPNALTILEAVEKAFPENDATWLQDLEALFKRMHHYIPERPTPRIVTFVDGYPRSIQQGLEQFIVTPKYLGIGMHYLMGEGYKYYPPDLPRYLSRRFNREHLGTRVAHRYADLFIPEPEIQTNPVLVDHMVHQGLQMYFVDKVLGPNVPDSTKLFYTSSQMDWADTYEAKAYKDLVPELYDVNSELLRRYIDDSPFTSQLNRKSAPRLGQYLGWKIIQAYVEKFPDEPVATLIQRRDYRKIFQAAGYRPEN